MRASQPSLLISCFARSTVIRFFAFASKMTENGVLQLMQTIQNISRQRFQERVLCMRPQLINHILITTSVAAVVCCVAIVYFAPHQSSWLLCSWNRQHAVLEATFACEAQKYNDSRSCGILPFTPTGTHVCSDYVQTQQTQRVLVKIDQGCWSVIMFEVK